MEALQQLVYVDCRGEEVPRGRRIHPDGEYPIVVEPEFRRPPLRVECSLEIAGAAQGVRLMYAAGQVIFGEGDGETLCWVDPCSGTYRRVQGMGRLPEGEVTILLELEPELARLSVNGVERFRTEGRYTKRLSGQVGIGIPQGTPLVLRSLCVTGEVAAEGHRIQKPQPLDYDGGLIDVLYDHHYEVLAWYEKHMGLQGTTWPGPSDRYADATLFSTLSLPNGSKFHLYSVLTRRRLAHWFSERGTVDGHVRFTFYSPDLRGTHAYFKELGTRVSEIATGPDGAECFDFYAPEGTRLTAVAAPGTAEKHPGARFAKFAPFRVGVTDLGRSAAWYEAMLGLRAEKWSASGGAVSLGEFLWLEHVPEEEHVGRVESPARVYLVCRSRLQFTELHQRLSECGAQPSDYMNEPGWRWSAFHFYDPDGNRLNVWSYY